MIKVDSSASLVYPGIISEKHLIILCEDNKIARRILESELELIDAEIVAVNDGYELLTAAVEKKPDIIISKIELSGLSGLEVCRKLKSDPDTRNIPITLISEIESDEERKEAYLSGAVSYIVAPFQRGRLAYTVKRLLEKADGNVPQTVLVAEDSDTIRGIIRNILVKHGHTVLEAADGIEAWELLQKRKDIDMIVSDVNMPNMDGRQFCRLVRGNLEFDMIPIIIASTLADKEDIAMLLNSGADDYIIKPFATEEFVARVRSHARVRQLYGDLKEANTKMKSFTESLEKMVEYRTRELHEANMEAIMMLAVASEHRDNDTGNHVRRIGEYVRELMLAMGYSQTKSEEVSYSSILHDVGKISIPDAILKKHGKLTEEEFGMMQEHTLAGEAILSKNPFFKSAREVARSHHEKFDGTGYPDGLKEYEIPLAARVVAVADVFDALTTKRVYKPAWSGEEAAKYIVEESGKHFDPLVVEAFKKVYDDGRIEMIRNRYT